MHSYKKQQGGASIMFVLCLLGLFGLFTLGVEGSRYLRTESRLNDATEIAGLVLAATNSVDAAANKKLAEAVVAAYMPDETKVTSTVSRAECDGSAKCNASGKAVSKGGAFVQYNVAATTTHKSWFPKTAAVPGFDKNVDISAKAVALKLPPAKADFVFALDVGEQMRVAPTAFKEAKKIISVFAEKIAENNKKSPQDLQQIAVVPYNERTRDKARLYIPETEGKIAHYKICDREELVLKTGKSAIETGPGKTHVLKKDINFSKTIDNILIEKKEICYKDTALLDRDFYTIPLTAPDSAVKAAELTTKMEDYLPGSNYTAAYEGLIRAAQIAAKGKQKRRTIILLSDGVVSDFDVFEELVKGHSLCNNIIGQLDALTTLEGENVESDIVMIKVGNKALDPLYSQCIAQHYSSSDGEEIYRKLNSDEVGHIYTGN